MHVLNKIKFIVQHAVRLGHIKAIILFPDTNLLALHGYRPLRRFTSSLLCFTTFLTALEHNFHSRHSSRKEIKGGGGGGVRHGKSSYQDMGSQCETKLPDNCVAAQFRVEKQHPAYLPADGGH
jgi:hypothetical protein